MIKVLHIVSHMNRAGQESRLMDILRANDKDKFQLDFLLSVKEECAYNDEIRALGGRIHYLPPVFKKPFKRYFGLKKLIKEYGYDIIHAHSSQSLRWSDMLAAKRAGVRVRAYHGRAASSVAKLLHYISRPINNRLTTHKFAVSKLAGEWVFGKKTVARGKVQIIPNAINTEKFRFNQETRDKVREHFGISDKFVMGHVGRFMPVKNHAFLLDIFLDVKKKQSNAVLLLAGGGKLKHEIEKKADDLGLAESVLFLGARDDVNELYQAMDVFVLPSLYEGLGMVAVEAQIAGLPTIVSHMVPTEAMVFDFVDFVDLQKGAQKWAEIILSKRNFKRIDTRSEPSAKRFSISDEVKNLEALYRQMLQKELI
jgi:glycosyltransferase involved in cell wall biosynthesis